MQDGIQRGLQTIRQQTGLDGALHPMRSPA